MVDSNIDFFKIEDNFAKTKNVESNLIIQSKLNFKPKVTIAIPTYKRPDLLKEAIDSAINQIDYDEYDIIVVDNNPERGCLTEHLIYAYNNPRISYYKNEENIGMFGNWNRCIELSKGNYLTILNDDDLLTSNYLMRTNSFIDKLGDVDALLVGFHVFSSSAEISVLTNSISKKVQRSKYLNLLFGNINPGSLGVFVKKSVLMKVGGFNDKFYPISDYAIWLNVLNKYKDIYILSEKLAYYRMAVNESLKIEIQEKNISYDKILREQLSTKILFLSRLIKIALPAFNYFHFKRVSEYSFDFKIKYADKLVELKRDLSYKSYISYFILRIIMKIQNRYSKLILSPLS